MELPPIGHYPSEEWFTLYRMLPESEKIRLTNESAQRTKMLREKVNMLFEETDLAIDKVSKTETDKCIAKAMRG